MAHIVRPVINVFPGLVKPRHSIQIVDDFFHELSDFLLVLSNLCIRASSSRTTVKSAHANLLDGSLNVPAQLYYILNEGQHTDNGEWVHGCTAGPTVGSRVIYRNKEAVPC